MAQAPTPGVGRRLEQAETAKTMLRLTLKGQTWTLTPGTLSFAERSTIRRATGGIPFETYWDGQAAIGIDSFVVLWWVMRRAGGEPKLTLDKVEAEFSELDLGEDDLKLEQVTVDEEPDSPEV